MKTLQAVLGTVLLMTSLGAFAGASSIGAIALPAPYHDTDELNRLVEQTVDRAIRDNPGATVNRDNEGVVIITAPIHFTQDMLRNVPQCTTTTTEIVNVDLTQDNN